MKQNVRNFDKYRDIPDEEEAQHPDHHHNQAGNGIDCFENFPDKFPFCQPEQVQQNIGYCKNHRQDKQKGIMMEGLYHLTAEQGLYKMRAAAGDTLAAVKHHDAGGFLTEHHL